MILSLSTIGVERKKLITTEEPITTNYDIKDTSTHNPIPHGVEGLYSTFQFTSLRPPLAFYGLPGIALLGIVAFFMRNALNLFSKIGYVSTNMIVIAVGIAVVGVVVVATAVILYTVLALLKEKINYS